MHPVIKHILARKNQRVPVNDGRKIVLVLFGGSMSGIIGAGAELALQELRLSNVFDEIYASSAGFPNASYLLSENVQDAISIYYEEMASKKFINLFRPFKIVDINYVVSVIQHDSKKKVDLDKILSKNTKVFVRVFNKITGHSEYIEVHDAGHKNYFQLMRATCALPVLFPIPIMIRGTRFRDGGFMERDIIDHYNYALDHSGATDVLAIFNHRHQLFPLHRDPETVFEIFPEREHGVDYFERDSEKLRMAGEEMAKLVRRIFQSPEPSLSLEYSESPTLDMIKEF